LRQRLLDDKNMTIQRAQLRDLLLPGVAAEEARCGHRAEGDLAIDDGGLRLCLSDGRGRAVERELASGREIETGEYKARFMPRVRAAFDEFLQETST
jgi:hypothetical protein